MRIATAFLLLEIPYCSWREAIHLLFHLDIWRTSKQLRMESKAVHQRPSSRCYFLQPHFLIVIAANVLLSTRLVACFESNAEDDRRASAAHYSPPPPRRFGPSIFLRSCSLTQFLLLSTSLLDLVIYHDNFTTGKLLYTYPRHNKDYCLMPSLICCFLFCSIFPDVKQ